MDIRRIEREEGEARDARERLRAAAPDLLAACEGAAELLEMLCYANNWETETDGELASATLATLVAAIRKARGEPE